MPLLSSELNSSLGKRAINSFLSIDEETQEAGANELLRSPGHCAALIVRAPTRSSMALAQTFRPQSLLCSSLCSLTVLLSWSRTS